MRLDFPTFERPAKQTSARSSGGRPDMATTPLRKSVSAAKSLRPASRDASSGSSASGKGSGADTPLLLLFWFSFEARLDVTEDVGLGAVAAHDHVLLHEGQR